MARKNWAVSTLAEPGQLKTKILNSSVAYKYFFLSNFCLPSSNCSRQGSGLCEQTPPEQPARRLKRSKTHSELSAFQGNLFISLLQYSIIVDKSLVKQL